MPSAEYLWQVGYWFFIYIKSVVFKFEELHF
jgi:hypothetical protein